MPETMQTTDPTPNPRAIVRPGFHWDRCPAYLFDIDGTLMRSRDRVHANAFAEGVRRVTGREISLEDVPMAGNTDTAILAEACRRAGLPEAFLAEHGAAIRNAMAEAVGDERDALDPLVLPGVEATLDHLAGRKALLGVASGNLEAIGWIKLARAGLRDRFRFGGFSDLYPVRSRLVAAAAAEASRILGRDHAGVCVVGDTPRDIEAARSAGLLVVLVATGRYGFDELAALKPDACATTLADLLALTLPAVPASGLSAPE